MRPTLQSLQPLGRALMLPIAVLPVAGLLLRLGQPDMLDIAFVAAAGDAIFANLGLLFAIGVAVGLARENHGAAGLAGVVCYLVTVEGGKTLLAVPPSVMAPFKDAAVQSIAGAAWKAAEFAKLSVPAGILSGVVAGTLYNRYATIKVPEYLAFFGGRRFVPIAAGFVGLGGAMLFGLGFPVLEGAVDGLSRWIVGAGSAGLFLYGVLNRLLLVTGLHHVLNNIAWFIVGEHAGATGDLKRFFAGDPTAGGFMAGFFPVMMFGLPAACLAMYHAAPPERRRGVAGLLLSLGLTSFLTGVTEPIEFTFMFLAPLLYVVHAVLTGVAMVVMDALGVKLGFGFSAGLFDYLLNFGLATRPLLLLPVGLAYAAIYYVVFRYSIVRFGLLTPGRDAPATTGAATGSPVPRADAIVAALGGAGNVREVNACTTRLRLVLGDTAAVDEAALRTLGARGVVRVGADGLQVVLGPMADLVAGEVRAALAQARSRAASDPVASAPADIWPALGGRGNVLGVTQSASRLCLRIADMDRIDRPALAIQVPRGVALVSGDRLHLIIGPDAAAWAAWMDVSAESRPRA